jgi:site-specific DNA-methyltransferase (adenine-specific)
VTWLDDCRIPYPDGEKSSAGNRTATFGNQETISGGDVSGGWEICKEGRFPANLLVSDGVLNGGYSRFFSLDAWAQKNLPFLIVPKASKKEKDAGCENLPEHKIVSMATCNGTSGVPSSITKGRNTIRKNNHPTVKPIKLMAYLVAMGSRPGDIVLDPFCGSGTTCVAAYLLGRKFLGIEIDKEYHNIAEARLREIITNTKPTDVPPMPLPAVNLEEVSSIKIKTNGSIMDMEEGELGKLMEHIINSPVEKGTHTYGDFKITTEMIEDEELATG